MQSPYLSLEGITKIFGTVTANSNVSLNVERGEIHALLGENGSGKSTLMNILSGIYAPDGGTLKIDGKEMHFTSPRDAIDAGVGMVHQHFKLVEILSAKDNIVLGRTKSLFPGGKALSDKIFETGKKYGLFVNPDKKVYDMSIGEKQTVEILKMLYNGATTLILDEPTAVLTPQEISTLFTILRKMRDDGCAIIIITHKMNEVMDISDRVTVMRRGETIATVNTAETTPQQLTEMMVGRPMKLEIKRTEYDGEGEELLHVSNLTAYDREAICTLNDVSFDLHRGEILGVAGISGNGQKELCEIIAGLAKSSGGEVTFKGENILGLSPRAIIAKGVSMSFIPEDRLGMGLVAGMDIVDNVLLKTYDEAKGSFVDRKAGSELAQSIVDKFEISTPSIHHVVRKLSGGNIQKVLLGREINLNPELLITAYPVRGLDIGASYHIYDVLNEQREKGVGILYIGEDLDVLIELCDKILVLHDRKVMQMVDARTATKEQIGLLMMGEGAKND